MALSTPTGTTPPAATLEALPPELRRHILFSITDLGDLRALVLASPVYYQLYLLDRRALLEATLASTLGTVVAEAVAVLESTESCGPSGEIISVEVMPFVNYYVRLRSQPPSTILNALSEQHLVTMARFYLTVAQPLVLKCAALFLWNLDISLEGFPLSDTERTRLLRALYRFELYCRVFGAGPRGHERLPTIAFRQQIILLFDSWKAWEIEEAWCIYALIGAKYEELFETIQLDADPDHDQPEELSGLDDPDVRQATRQGTAVRGLHLFRSVLDASDQEQASKVLQASIREWGDIDVNFLFITQVFRRSNPDREPDFAEARREILRNSGDRGEWPNLAWVVMWDGRHFNGYEGLVDMSLKLSGFVFWDAGRMTTSLRAAIERLS